MTKPFNNLYNEVYGHFYKSQNTLRVARQDLFTTASTFPWYKLTSGTRTSLAAKIASINSDCIDPTVDYLQKTAMTRFFDYTSGKATAIEDEIKPAVTQLIELEDAVRGVTDNVCLAKIKLTSAKLIKEYSNFTKAVDTCIKNATIAYRPLTKAFTQLHLAALPLINRMNTELIKCENGKPDAETCVIAWLAKYCDDTTTCPHCGTM